MGRLRCCVEACQCILCTEFTILLNSQQLTSSHKQMQRYFKQFPAAQIEGLFQEDYYLWLTARLQCDALERTFSRYRQISGGRCQVSAKEIEVSEKFSSQVSFVIQPLLKNLIHFDFHTECISTSP